MESNPTTQEEMQFEFYSRESLPEILNPNLLICCILACLLGITGLIGNALMIRAWCCYSKLRNDFYTVLVFLSLADTGFLLIDVPYFILQMLQMFPATNAWCNSIPYLTNAFGFLAAYLLVALATLRAILLTNRNTIPRPRARHMIVICVACAVVVFLISIPVAKMYIVDEDSCVPADDVDIIKQTWLLDSFSTLVPLLLILLLYVLAHFLGKRFFSDSYSPRERQKSRLVSWIIVTFALLQLPFSTIDICLEYFFMQNHPEAFFRRIIIIKDYLHCLMIADKVVRPIICSKLASDLGHAFDEVINCQTCGKRSRRSLRRDTETMEVTSPDTIPPSAACVAAIGAMSSGESENGDPDPELPSPLPTKSFFDTDSGFGRSISTSSSASTNSQTPLVRANQSLPSDMELL